jgi:hypothetical protein
MFNYFKYLLHKYLNKIFMFKSLYWTFTKKHSPYSCFFNNLNALESCQAWHKYICQSK